MTEYQRRRNIVTRPDGRPVNVARPRGHLFVCADACCCGQTEDGMPAVPVVAYNTEWERRRLRNVVHLTIGGCLGPCALANVCMLLFDGQALWFQAMDSEAAVRDLYDYAEAMLDANGYLPPPPALAHRHFSGSAWQPRPDGQPVDDYRPRRPARAAPPEDYCLVPHDDERPREPDRLVADMDGVAAAPRKNGELVFDAPWQGRAFGMAVALSEGRAYDWEEFRTRLIAEMAEADAGRAPADYYTRWLAAFESLLTSKGIVTGEELDERTYQFEFGERDEVF